MSAKTKKEGGVGLKDKAHEEVKEPKKYLVVFHNDDFTPMDFVVAVLMQVFHHPQPKAVQIMLDVHRKGRGIAGVFSHEVAETKMEISRQLARKHEHPLEVTIEPE